MILRANTAGRAKVTDLVQILQLELLFESFDERGLQLRFAFGLEDWQLALLYRVDEVQLWLVAQIEECHPLAVLGPLLSPQRVGLHYAR